MSRRTHRARTTIAGVVSIEHPLRALIVAAVLAAATHVGLGVLGQQYRSDGEGVNVTVTFDAAVDRAQLDRPLVLS